MLGPRDGTTSRVPQRKKTEPRTGISASPRTRGSTATATPLGTRPKARALWQTWNTEDEAKNAPVPDRSPAKPPPRRREISEERVNVLRPFFSRPVVILGSLRSIKSGHDGSPHSRAQPQASSRVHPLTPRPIFTQVLTSPALDCMAGRLQKLGSRNQVLQKKWNSRQGGRRSTRDYLQRVLRTNTIRGEKEEGG